MFKYLQILFLGLSLMFGNTTFCQTGNDCARLDGIYKRLLLKNNFALWKQYQMTVEKTDSSFHLIIDTNATTKFLYKKVINENLNLHVYQTRSNNDLYYNFFLIDEQNKDTLYRTKYQNTNIGFYYSTSKVYIWENFILSVLDTTNKIVTPTIFTKCNVIGADVNSLYLLNFNKIDIDGRVCYGESLFRIGEKEAKCIIPQYHRRHTKRDFSKINKLEFITDEYVLERIGLTHVEVNCYRETYYNYSLSYRGTVIDSILTNLPYEKARVNSFNGDTLKIENYNVHYIYLNGNKINVINITDTISKNLIRILGGSIDFDIVDNYLLASKNYQFKTIDSILYNKENGITINKLNPVDEGDGLEIIYLFDKNTMEFLGYPEVVFR